MIVVSYGGGTNSAGLILGMFEKGIRPDLITFADTGAEKPHTYAHIVQMNNWLMAQGWPQIVTVRKEFRTGNSKKTWKYEIVALDDYFMAKNMLPTIAYGFKNCSQKFKLEPQEKYWNNHKGCLEAWERGEQVTMIVGYDADETRRVTNARAKLARDMVLNKKFVYEYPLHDWGWYREDCIEAIERHGIQRPGKSACYCCPSTKKGELLRMEEDYPHLVNKALMMELGADLESIKGLGRSWNWFDFLMNPTVDAHEKDFDMPCDCFDARDDDD